MVYGQMGWVSYRRLGKTSITGECEDISVIPSRYVMFYLLSFLLCQKFIKHGIISPCFRSLKPRFYTSSPICHVAFCVYKPSYLFKNTKHSFARECVLLSNNRLYKLINCRASTESFSLRFFLLVSL